MPAVIQQDDMRDQRSNIGVSSGFHRSNTGVWCFWTRPRRQTVSRRRLDQVREAALPSIASDQRLTGLPAMIGIIQLG